MTNHTPEPWFYVGPDFMGDYSVRANNYYSNIVMRVHTDISAKIHEKVNAERIVACVNFCAGVPTETLTNGGMSRAALRTENEALRAALEGLLTAREFKRNDVEWNTRALIEEARAALSGKE